MKVSQDTKQRIMSSALFCLEFYKVLMGTLLVLFVPQDCDGELCSVVSNAMFQGYIHNTVMIINYVTLGMVTFLYYVELRRENWCIEYLDIDHDKPTTYLDDEIEKYPSIKTRMRNLNKLYSKATYGSMIMIFVNIIASSAYILPRNYSSNTITSLASFSILVLMKLYAAYDISVKSLKEEHAYSGYMKTSVTYNVIDEQYRIPDNVETEVHNMNDEDNDNNQQDEEENTVTSRRSTVSNEVHIEIEDSSDGEHSHNSETSGELRERNVV